MDRGIVIVSVAGADEDTISKIISNIQKTIKDEPTIPEREELKLESRLVMLDEDIKVCDIPPHDGSKDRLREMVKKDLNKLRIGKEPRKRKKIYRVKRPEKDRG